MRKRNESALPLILTITFFLLIPVSSSAQDTLSEISRDLTDTLCDTFCEEALGRGAWTFRPAVASVFEPRAGFNFFSNEINLRLDAGTGIEFYRRPWKGGRLAVGGEFITYTLLESWDEMYFPVITTDYFFGLKISYARPSDKGLYSFRFRFTHISSHLVDGHYDADEASWREGYEPFIYSREFLEILGAYRTGTDIYHRWYGGFQYIYNVTPSGLGNISLQGGYEIFIPTSWSWITPYAAYDVRLVDIDGWNLNHSVQGGVKIGRVFGRGVDVFFSYYNGYSVQGMFFDEKTDYLGWGLNLHL